MPVGEDAASFSRHNSDLKKEFCKVKPNLIKVEQLMTLSFAMRRNDVIFSTHTVKEIVTRYPFLSVRDEVSTVNCCP